MCSQTNGLDRLRPGYNNQRSSEGDTEQKHMVSKKAFLIRAVKSPMQVRMHTDMYPENSEFRALTMSWLFDSLTYSYCGQETQEPFGLPLGHTLAWS